ncbi:MAG: type VII secretion-associated serine protease mycosin [Hamadaea sp.]|nr:type VII secretion-associated serine protease mycosin [Hamadaea sp.]
MAVTAAASVPAPAAAHGGAIRAKQWHLGFLKIAEAHKFSQGAGVTVAVIDTGVADHEDLSGNVLNGVDAIKGGAGNGRGDGDGHGTGMAGLIAAHGHGSGNRDGALGIAPKAKILPVRLTIGSVTGGDVPLAAGIRWAVSHGAKIINISQDIDGTETLRAVNEAQAAGVLIFAAAGNTDQNDTSVSAPGRYPWAVAVAGVGKDGNRAPTSVSGAEVELSAPSVEIYSTSKGGIWRFGTGTSDSTAIASGVAALVWSKFPELTAQEVLRRMEVTATDKGAAGRDPIYGYGVLDPVKALTAEVAPSASPTQKSPSPLPTQASRGPQAAPDDSGNGTVLLAVAAVGGLLVLALIGVVIFLATRSRRGPRGPQPPRGGPPPYVGTPGPPPGPSQNWNNGPRP